MKYRIVKNFIDGKFIETANPDKLLDIISPLDGSLLSKVCLSSSYDLDAAANAAKNAFPSWSKKSIKERVQVFFRYRNLLEQHIDTLAELCSEENGKTIGESIAEIEKSIELTEF